MKKRALFAISSLGLGHATRSLTVIEYFLGKGCKIDIVSYSGALKYLKKELDGRNVSFTNLKDYPPLERGKGIFYYIYLLLDLITTYLIIRKERRFLRKNNSKYDFIFSDGRYGFCSKEIPSYLLSHQLSFHLPGKLNFFSDISDFYNKRTFKKFNRVFIPDYEDKENNLAGNLSHPARIKEISYSFVGILSSFYDKKDFGKEGNLDYLFTITGYLKENKKEFLEKIIKSAKKLNGKKVFVLGDYDNSQNNEDGNTKFFPCVFGEQKLRFFNNAKTIISRAGYTTIMDMVELNKKAILFPTKGQTEQEYLALYLGNKKLFVIGEEGVEIKEFVNKIKTLKSSSFPGKTKEALEKIFKEINKDLG